MPKQAIAPLRLTVTATGELAPAVPPPPPPLNLALADETWLTAVKAVRYLPTVYAPEIYDPRLDVLRGFFHAYAAGTLPHEALLTGVHTELAVLDATPVTALLAYERVKAGFLALGEPEIAAIFGHRAAGLWQRLLADARTSIGTEEDSDVS